MCFPSRVDDSLDQLANSYFFTTLDLALGYWQVLVDDNLRKKKKNCDTFRPVRVLSDTFWLKKQRSVLMPSPHTR